MKKFTTLEEAEAMFTGGVMSMTPELRAQQAQQNIADRRFYVWCEKHGIEETYEAMVAALFEYYEEMEKRQDSLDKYDRTSFEAWKTLTEEGFWALAEKNMGESLE